MKKTLAEIARNYLAARNLFPEMRFRIPVIACLLGSGATAIYVASSL
jgi:hypothetical protein